MAQRKFTDAFVGQIPGWVANGDSKEVIAARIGVTVGTLAVTCSKLKISLDPLHYQDLVGKTAVTILLQIPLKRRLLDEAKERGMSANELISDLLTHIARDDMFKAVLDCE